MVFGKNVVLEVLIIETLDHLRFWRDVEAEEARVPVVVAALLVLVDLLLKHTVIKTTITTNTMRITTNTNTNDGIHWQETARPSKRP